MRYIVLFIFLFLPTSLFGQSIDSLETQISELNNKLNHYDQKIDSLKQIRNKIDEKVSQIKQKISRIELEQKTEKGIPTKLASDGKLRSDPAVYGEVIAEPKRGNQILIYSLAEDQYFKASYNDTIGYISHTYLEKIEFITESLESAKPRLTELTEIYGKNVAKRLLNGQIWIGMTDEMAEIALGTPEDINRSTGSWGTHEQWIYPDGKYLYFENGELVCRGSRLFPTQGH